MRCTALTRRCGCGSLYVRELSAGAAFVPAGFSPGTGDCARGGTDGGTDGGTVGERRGDAELLPSRAVGLAVLAGRLSSVHARLCGSVAALFLGARPALRSCRGAFPRFTPAVCLATNRTACDMLRSYSAGSRSPFARSRGVSAVICLCWFTSGLAVSLWRSRRGTKRRGGRGDGERGWRRGACASLRNHIGLVMLSAGSPLGAARPQTCAKESSTLWTLFTLRRGWGGACSLRRHPGRSCGCTIAPTRSNVQTQAARRQRRGVGFQRAERSGSGTAASLDSLHLIRGVGA